MENGRQMVKLGFIFDRPVLWDAGIHLSTCSTAILPPIAPFHLVSLALLSCSTGLVPSYERVSSQRAGVQHTESFNDAL